ncbi:hypothetical protein DFP72DRAFT_846993 [Ephemerocybe angulata]|uniref:Uncharacterized protein n=1 Tax=Ephemerocybe angulata TaxID=980116 RepID=A0A8H6I2I9_9AGAR|nr:hypothetical protein DFP72DRAFT_846993 [Tulosesus angulatus]
MLPPLSAHIHITLVKQDGYCPGYEVTDRRALGGYLLLPPSPLIRLYAIHDGGAEIRTNTPNTPEYTSEATGHHAPIKSGSGTKRRVWSRCRMKRLAIEDLEDQGKRARVIIRVYLMSEIEVNLAFPSLNRRPSTITRSTWKCLPKEDRGYQAVFHSSQPSRIAHSSTHDFHLSAKACKVFVPVQRLLAMEEIAENSLRLIDRSNFSSLLMIVAERSACITEMLMVQDLTNPLRCQEPRRSSKYPLFLLVKQLRTTTLNLGLTSKREM